MLERVQLQAANTHRLDCSLFYYVYGIYCISYNRKKRKNCDGFKEKKRPKNTMLDGLIMIKNLTLCTLSLSFMQERRLIRVSINKKAPLDTEEISQSGLTIVMNRSKVHTWYNPHIKGGKTWKLIPPQDIKIKLTNNIAYKKGIPLPPPHPVFQYSPTETLIKYCADTKAREYTWKKNKQ